MEKNKLNEDLLSGSKVSMDDLNNLFNCTDDETLTLNEQIEEVVSETRKHISNLKEIKSNGKITKITVEEKLFLTYLNDYIEGCIDCGALTDMNDAIVAIDCINNQLVHDGHAPCLDFSYLESNELIRVYFDEQLECNMCIITAKGENEVNNYE